MSWMQRLKRVFHIDIEVAESRVWGEDVSTMESPTAGANRPEAGFTLIELLAATAILAIIALSAVLSLRLAPGETPAARMDELARAVRFLQEEAMYTRRNFAFLGRDLENAAPRGVRDRAGELLPVLALETEGEALIFTRGGLPNPAGLPRSGFQRVRYALGRSGRGIERQVWRLLDPAPRQKPEVETLIDDVQRVQFRVWTRESGWRDSWPDPENPASRARLPEGIEAVLDTRRFGTLRRVVSLR